MLTTFILDEDINFDLPDVDLVPLEKNVAGFYHRLRAAIEYGIDNKEDIIYCICGPNFQQNLDFQKIEWAINEFFEENIFGFYIDVEHEGSFYIHQHISLITNIKRVSSFILMRPLYSKIRMMLDEVELGHKMEIPDFMRGVFPDALKFEKAQDKNVIKNKFHLISAFRNAEKFVSDFFRSVLKQDYPFSSLNIIDDNSTDKSAEKIPVAPNLFFQKNNTRKYLLKNTIDALMDNNYQDEDIICLVDADDYLPHKYVVNILNSVYEDPSILATYSTMNCVATSFPVGSIYSAEEFSNLRAAPWKITHLRTFRFKVFKELLKQDHKMSCFKNEHGEFIRMPADMALLFPIFEIAGFDRVKFIKSPLYSYRVHENNDHNTARDEQKNGEILIRSKRKFKRLEEFQQ